MSISGKPVLRSATRRDSYVRFGRRMRSKRRHLNPYEVGGCSLAATICYCRPHRVCGLGHHRHHAWRKQCHDRHPSIRGRNERLQHEHADDAWCSHLSFLNRLRFRVLSLADPSSLAFPPVRPQRLYFFPKSLPWKSVRARRVCADTTWRLAKNRGNLRGGSSVSVRGM